LLLVNESLASNVGFSFSGASVDIVALSSLAADDSASSESVFSARRASAHAIASFFPFRTSTKIHMTAVETKHRPNKNVNPYQLLLVASMIAWITLGPIALEATFENPKRPKNILS